MTWIYVLKLIEQSRKLKPTIWLIAQIRIDEQTGVIRFNKPSPPLWLV